MKSVVVYESMYGNTHLIAQAIGEGLAEFGDVAVVPVHRAAAEIAGADLLVVGGPTHAHGLSRAATREGAIAAAAKPESPLEVDPDASGPGVREWLDSLDRIDIDAAAFDTRVDMSAVLTGRASKGIAHRLRHHGARLVVEPESFVVNRGDRLEPHEEDRARNWAANLGRLRVEASRV